MALYYQRTDVPTLSESIYSADDVDLYGAMCDELDRQDQQDSVRRAAASSYEPVNVYALPGVRALSPYAGALDTATGFSATDVDAPAPSAKPAQQKKSSDATDDILARYYWNERLQLLLERPTFTREEARQRIRDIEALLSRFVTAATPVVETIVKEVDQVDKSIPPLSIGGIAGGDKFVTQNLFVKFCSGDKVNALYGGAHWAQKAASHELKSLNALISTNVVGLHFPLVALFMCRGYRVMVISKLPISSATLVYGSADAGLTIHTDKEFDVLLRQATAKLNLKPHKCLEQSSDILKEICGPVDLEGHLGLDTRHYVCDAARLMPPTLPLKACPGSHLYKLFRREYLQLHCQGRPLSSDACSGFGRHDHRIHNQEVLEATTKILTELIPSVCAPGPVDEWKRNAKDHMHAHGLNLRFLGMVFMAMPPGDERREVVLGEMVVRAVKNELYGIMRSAGPSLLEKCVTYLNSVFGKFYEDHWRANGVPLLARYFEFCRSPSYNDPALVEQAVLSALGTLLERAGVRRELLVRASDMAGIEFFRERLEALDCEAEAPLAKDALVGVRTQVKLMRFDGVLEDATKTFEEMEVIYQQSIAQCMKIGGKSLQAIKHILNLATLYANQRGRERDAIAQFERAVQFSSDLRGSDSLTTAEIKERLVNFLAVHDPKKASAMLSEVLRVKMGVQGIQVETAQSLDLAAILATYSGDNDEALRILDEALHLKRQFSTEFDVARSEFLRGRVLFAQRKYTDARDTFERLQTVYQPPAAKSSEIAVLLDWLAQSYAKLERLEEAFDVFSRALSLKEEAFGNMHVSTAATLSHFAASRALPEEQAHELFLRSFHIVSTICSPGHFSRGVVLHNLVKHDLAQSRLDDAQAHLDEALAILRNQLGDNHLDLVAARGLRDALSSKPPESLVKQFQWISYPEIPTALVTASASFDIRTLSSELLTWLRDAGVTDEQLNDPEQCEMIFTALMETLSELQQQQQERERKEKKETQRQRQQETSHYADVSGYAEGGYGGGAASLEEEKEEEALEAEAQMRDEDEEDYSDSALRRADMTLAPPQPSAAPMPPPPPPSASGGAAAPPPPPPAEPAEAAAPVELMALEVDELKQKDEGLEDVSGLLLAPDKSKKGERKKKKKEEEAKDQPEKTKVGILSSITGFFRRSSSVSAAPAPPTPTSSSSSSASSVSPSSSSFVTSSASAPYPVSAPAPAPAAPAARVPASRSERFDLRTDDLDDIDSMGGLPASTRGSTSQRRSSSKKAFAAWGSPDEKQQQQQQQEQQQQQVLPPPRQKLSVSPPAAPRKSNISPSQVPGQQPQQSPKARPVLSAPTNPAPAPTSFGGKGRGDASRKPGVDSFSKKSKMASKRRSQEAAPSIASDLAAAEEAAPAPSIKQLGDDAKKNAADILRAKLQQKMQQQRK